MNHHTFDDEDDAHVELTDQQVVWYVQHGVTPRAVEIAYQHSQVRVLAGQKDIHLPDIQALSRRWGIKGVRD